MAHSLSLGCNTEDAGSPGDGPVISMDCTGIVRSQGISQPCCLAFGIDACGANLFCAAFDGRTQPTCYAEHSRQGLESCTEDRQCASDGCNTTSGQCQSLPGATCDSSVGCNDRVSSNYYVCFDNQCEESLPCSEVFYWLKAGQCTPLTYCYRALNNNPVFRQAMACGQDHCVTAGKCVNDANMLVDPPTVSMGTCDRCLDNSLAKVFGTTCNGTTDCNPTECTSVYDACLADE